MKRIIVALFISVGAFAQPFTYLGIRDGLSGAFTGINKDSLYITGSGSSVNTSARAETLLVDQSFTYMGYNAKGIQRKVYYGSTPSPLFEDTVYEVGDTVHRLMVVGKTSPSTYLKADVKAIVIPFVVGNSWTLGIVGDTFIADIDGDTLWSMPDTFIITKDSMYVVSMGTVTVPAGTFDSVYTIRLRLEGRLWSSAVRTRTGSSSAAWSDTLYRNYYIWWKPGVGYVKDSMFQYVKWTYLFVSIRAFNWVTSELQAYWLGVSENENTVYRNITFGDGGIYIPKFGEVYSINGRKVAQGKGRIPLERGVYFVIVEGRVYKVLIK